MNVMNKACDGVMGTNEQPFGGRLATFRQGRGSGLPDPSYHDAHNTLILPCQEHNVC